MDIQEYIDEVRERMSKIPDFDKGMVEPLLEVLPYMEPLEQRKVMADIDSLVNPAYSEHVSKSKNPVLSFPSREESKGDGLTFGNVMAGDMELYPFELTAENAQEGTVVEARSGHGKTSLVYFFVKSLSSTGASFVFWDWKRDYGPIASLHPDIAVIRWSDIRFNPLTNVPPGVDIRVWWRIVLDIFSHCFGVLVATPSFMLESIEELYDEKHGIVTFGDLLHRLRSMSESSKKRTEYLDVAENRLFTLNQALGEVVNVKRGFDVSELFRRRLVIQLDPLDTPIASFLVQTLIMHEFHRRLAAGVRADQKSTPEEQLGPDFCMNIMDEGHNLAYRGFEEGLVSTELSPHPLVKYFSQCRELLMSNFVLTQFPDLLMKAIHNNAGVKIIGNITETDNQRYVGSSIGLEPDEYKILGKLKKGTWVASVAGRTKPFLVSTPFVARNQVAEAELMQRSKPILGVLEMKRREIEAKMFLSQVDRTEQKLALPQLSKEAWLVLDYVFQHEWHYQQQVTQALGLSDRLMAKAKKELVERGLVKIEKFAVKVHERIHYTLTPNALEMLQAVGRSPQRIAYWKWITGVPGYEHKYWSNLFRVKHKILGWTGRLEHTFKDGRRVDVYEEKAGYRKAMEIELSTRDLENKAKVVADGEVDELVLLYKDESTSQLVRSKLEKMQGIPKDRIWVGVIRDYVEILDDIIHAEMAGNKQQELAAGSETGTTRKDGGNTEDDPAD